jgi:two-component system cell cycle sensor histidine kinase/response regulator CckA
VLAVFFLLKKPEDCIWWTNSKGRLLLRAGKRDFFPHLSKVYELTYSIPETSLHPFFTELEKKKNTLVQFVDIKEKDQSYSIKVTKAYIGGGLWKWSFEQQENASFFQSLKKAFLGYPWPFCMAQDDGSIVFVNTAFSHWLGYSTPMLMGETVLSLFKKPPTSFSEFQTQAYLLKNARGLWVSGVVSSMVSFPQHDLVGLFFFPFDMATKTPLLGDVPLLAQLPLPAALLDEYGGIKSYNTLLNPYLSEMKVAPLPLIQWIAEKERAGFLKTLKRLHKTTQKTEEILTLRFRAKETLRVLAFIRHLPAEHPEKPGQFLIMFDPHAEEQLFQGKESDSQRMQLLGQLASGIVHDFNNLLTGIMGFCDLLLERHRTEESSFKDIEQIKGNSMRAAKLIQQLLAFSKSSPPTQTPIHIGRCLEDLSPLVRRMIGPKIIFCIEDKAESKMLYGDQSQIEQILLNLAINARDSMVGGGSITVRLSSVSLKQKMNMVKGVLEPGRYLVIEIADTGTGIDAKYVKRIFEPFFSTKEPGQGTGLGLANVLQIVEQMQGGICIETKVGQGTCFSLYFPEYEGHEVVPLPTPLVKPLIESMGIRILLVEDEDPIRLFASRALREKGHDVIEARDGVQAMRLLEKHPQTQIVVTDVMMPGIDGPSLAASISETHPAIKILFVSGYPEDEVRSHLPEAMRDVYFLQKPFALADLVNEIQRLFSSEEKK